MRPKKSSASEELRTSSPLLKAELLTLKTVNFSSETKLPDIHLEHDSDIAEGSVFFLLFDICKKNLKIARGPLFFDIFGAPSAPFIR